MVSIPEDPTPPRSFRGTWLTGPLVLIAMLLLWWADIQQESLQRIMGSTFQVAAGGWAFWTLTLVAVGVCFGLAVAAAAGWRQRIAGTGLIWVIVPFIPLVGLQLWFAGMFNVGNSAARAMTSPSVQVACALAVGMFLAGLLAPLLPESEARTEDVPTSPSPSPEDA